MKRRLTKLFLIPPIILASLIGFDGDLLDCERISIWAEREMATYDDLLRE